MATANVDIKTIEKRAFGKLFLDLMSGRSNLSGMIRFLDQIHDPELQAIKPRMKRNSLIYESMVREVSERKKPLSSWQIPPGQLDPIKIKDAFEKLSEAYCDAYSGLMIALNASGIRASFDDQEWKEQLYYALKGIIAGDVRLPVEERELLQFIVMGIMSEYPPKTAYDVIHSAVGVLKFGYLCNAELLDEFSNYEKAVEAYTIVFDEASKKLHL